MDCSFSWYVMSLMVTRNAFTLHSICLILKMWSWILFLFLFIFSFFKSLFSTMMYPFILNGSLFFPTYCVSFKCNACLCSLISDVTPNYTCYNYFYQDFSAFFNVSYAISFCFFSFKSLPFLPLDRLNFLLLVLKEYILLYSNSVCLYLNINLVFSKTYQ